MKHIQLIPVAYPIPIQNHKWGYWLVCEQFEFFWNRHQKATKPSVRIHTLHRHATQPLKQRSFFIWVARVCMVTSTAGSELRCGCRVLSFRLPVRKIGRPVYAWYIPGRDFWLVVVRFGFCSLYRNIWRVYLLVAPVLSRVLFVWGGGFLVVKTPLWPGPSFAPPLPPLKRPNHHPWNRA